MELRFQLLFREGLVFVAIFAFLPCLHALFQRWLEQKVSWSWWRKSMKNYRRICKYWRHFCLWNRRRIRKNYALALETFLSMPTNVRLRFRQVPKIKEYKILIIFFSLELCFVSYIFVFFQRCFLNEENMRLIICFYIDFSKRSHTVFLSGVSSFDDDTDSIPLSFSFSISSNSIWSIKFTSLKSWCKNYSNSLFCRSSKALAMNANYFSTYFGAKQVVSSWI